MTRKDRMRAVQGFKNNTRTNASRENMRNSYTVGDLRGGPWRLNKWR